MFLKIVIGPMFSNKTSLLIEEAKNKDNPLVINSSLDKLRGVPQDHIRTHDGYTFKGLMVKNLFQLKDNQKFINSKYILIDEGQFFNDLYDFIKFYEKSDKHFIVAGLSGDYLMKPIGQINLLIPMCDELLKLNSVCKSCGSIAHFTKLRKNTNNFNLIGGEDIYSAVCRKCYFTL